MKTFTRKKLSASIIALSTALVITPIVGSTAAWGVSCPKGLTVQQFLKALKHGGTLGKKWKVTNPASLNLLLQQHPSTQGYTYTLKRSIDTNTCLYTLEISKKDTVTLDATVDISPQ